MIVKLSCVYRLDGHAAKLSIAITIFYYTCAEGYHILKYTNWSTDMQLYIFNIYHVIVRYQG